MFAILVVSFVFASTLLIPTISSGVDLIKLDKICDSQIVNNAFCVKKAREHAVVTRSSSVLGRDGGTAGRIGPWLVWTWGDTFTKPPAAPGSLRNILSHTMSVSLASNVAYNVHFENLDPDKRPFQTIAYTTAEADYNECSWSVTSRPARCDTLNPRPPRARCNFAPGSSEGRCEVNSSRTCDEHKDCISRIAHWPTVPIETMTVGCEAGRTQPGCIGFGDIFYNSFLIVGEEDYSWLGTGIARVYQATNSIQTQTTRVLQENGKPMYVFQPGGNEIGFSPSLVEDDYLYLLGSKVFPDSEYGLGTRVIARVKMGSQHLRGSYTFWTGSGWSSSISSLGKTNLSPGNGSRIYWNRYLKQYLFISQSLINGKQLKIQAAAKLTGPWSNLVDYFETRAVPPPAPGTFKFGNYYSEVHPELSSGPNFYVSYYHNAGPKFEIPLVRAKLHKFKSLNSCVGITAPASVTLGQSFNIRVTLRNDSYVTWGPTTHSVVDYFVERDGQGSHRDFFGVTGAAMPRNVAPNGTVTVDVPARARVRGASQYVSLRVKNGNENFGFGCSTRIAVR